MSKILAVSVLLIILITLIIDIIYIPAIILYFLPTIYAIYTNLFTKRIEIKKLIGFGFANIFVGVTIFGWVILFYLIKDEK